MLTLPEIQQLMACFDLSVQAVTGFHDTSHSEEDQRLNYILDDRYVLKVHSAAVMPEVRLQEIQRLIGRYRSIGVYCPALLPTRSGTLSCPLTRDGKTYACFVEEYAAYPILREGRYDRSEVLEHLGLLAARYTGVDLSSTRSMWSIIDLAPLDTDVDEKQENALMLIGALRQWGYDALADRVHALNTLLRDRIMTVFATLPRCVYQGDLNTSNLLQQNGHFAGLIDFNMAGTDVNINVFLNETNCFPDDEAAFDALPVPALITQMNAEQDALLAPILRHYPLNAQETYALPLYRRIVQLFQYPNVCLMVACLKDAGRRAKCAALITALVEQPLF